MTSGCPTSKEPQVSGLAGRFSGFPRVCPAGPGGRRSFDVRRVECGRQGGRDAEQAGPGGRCAGPTERATRGKSGALRLQMSIAFSRHSSGVRKGRAAPRAAVAGLGATDGLSAHRRPGYPLVGLLASRARLRFTRLPRNTAGADREQGQARQDAGSPLVGGRDTPASQERQRGRGLENGPYDPQN